MKKAALLVQILLLTAVIALVVAFDSPTQAVVQPPQDIEVLWAIEDTRSPSDGPLVTRLQNDGVPAAYSAQDNTFYCTLGLEQGDEWPPIHLTAPGADGVSLCFSDDYTYDWCRDAIAEGYSYEVMAYTDTHYDYFYVVFTGLPIVSLQTEGTIAEADTAAQVAISAYGETPVVTSASAHVRGAGSSLSEKKSYHVDFVRGYGRSNVLAQVPGIGVTDDLILQAGVMDETLMRDKLSWALYGSIAPQQEPYGARAVEYVEVFINDAYAGLYLMLEPVDDGRELAKAGESSAHTDSVYRSAQLLYGLRDRPYLENPVRENSVYELHYGNQDDPFALLGPYMALETMEDDAAFCEAALACIDLESILRYYLFVQAGGMSDNVYNNMYILAHPAGDGVHYRFAPWDMDLTWGRGKDEATGEFFDGLYSFGIAQRMIDLDAGGVTRGMLTRLWTQMRAGAFTEENVQALVEGYMHELNASGAYARSAARWGLGASSADGYEIVAFAGQHFATLDALFGESGAGGGTL